MTVTEVLVQFEHREPVGTGEAAFKYLAPYVFRVAISNNRILKLESGEVTFKYKDSATDETRFCSVTAQEFIRRFLQHILPEGFIKVRYYGLLSPGNRKLLIRARKLLGEPSKPAHLNVQTAPVKTAPAPACCPNCGTILTLIREFKRRCGLPP